MNTLAASPFGGLSHVAVPTSGDGAELASRLAAVQGRVRSLEAQLEGAEADHDRYLGDIRVIADRCDQISNRIAPLGKEYNAGFKVEKATKYTGIGSGCMLLPSVLVAQAGHPMVGMGMLLTSAVVLGASFLATQWARNTMARTGPDFDAGFAQWTREKSRLDSLRAAHAGDAARMSGIVAEIKASQGQEQVLSMALSQPIAQPAPPEVTISQNDEAIIIGGLRIPKRIRD